MLRVSLASSGRDNHAPMSRSEQIALAMDGSRQRLHLSGLSGFHEKAKLREKFAIFCRTASAIRLEKVSNHHFKTNTEIQTCQQQSSLNKKNDNSTIRKFG